MQGLDYGIIIGYFVFILIVGLLLSKKASGSIDEYFLAGRHIPWYILGLSGVATYVDMSGTMVQTSFFYIKGVQGYWFCFRGAIALTLAFAMIFMGKWHRRTGVMTNAQLMELRFGTGWQGEMARLLSAISVILFSIAGISFFFVGTQKFLTEYLPLPGHISALILFAIILGYTMASGFYGVVYTDLFQTLLVFVVIIFVVFKAISIGTPEFYQNVAPEGFRTLMPKWEIDMPPGYEHQKLLIALLCTWFVMNIVQGFSQPFDSHSSQRFYASRNERESSLIPFQWILLLSLRFLLMMGIGVMAVKIKDSITDPEMALPAVINAFFPVGLKGLFIAALIAAAMSTIDSGLNSSAVYFVKDIYHRHLKPSATRDHLVKISYFTTAGIMVIGIIIGWFIPSINEIWGWLIVGFITGLLPPGIMRWLWWRCNGLGYAFGVGFGMLAAILQQFVVDVPEFISFFFILGISWLGSIIGIFMSKPTDMDRLVNFYKRIKPFGFWGPVRAQCESEFVCEVKKETTRDLLLLIPACIFQCVLFWFMTAIVVKKWISVGMSAIILAVCGVILYKYWYKQLKPTVPESYEY